MAIPFFTIGHSNRSLDAFVALLQEHAIEQVADIRRIPRSRAQPQFNQDTLPAELGQAGIGYEHMAALGGRRGKAAVDPAINAFWTNPSFHRYADYALGASFHAGLAHLLGHGHLKRTAVMCAEAVWWRCHRRIVADYLLASGATVWHILGPHQLEPARLNLGAVPRPDGTIVYPGGMA